MLLKNSILNIPSLFKGKGNPYNQDSLFLHSQFV